MKIQQGNLVLSPIPESASSTKTSMTCVRSEVNDNNVNHKDEEGYTFKGTGSSSSPINISDEEEFVKSDDVMDLLEESQSKICH